MADSRRVGLAALWFLAFVAIGVVAPSSSNASGLILEGEFVQGGLIRGQAPPGSKVWFENRALRISPEGWFAFGFGRNFSSEARLLARYPDGREEIRRLVIGKRTYRVQRIDGLPPKMVTPGAEALKRIRKEAAQIRTVRATDTAGGWFAAGFVWPVIGTISGVYGSQRILNGEPRRPHYGIDIAALAGTPVRAPAAGKVALAEADLYFTGGTVMLDHGHGVTSVYSHLAKITVALGDFLNRGDVLGTVGSTGRSTGPHLDWRINWFDQRLDPALLAGPMPKTSAK